MRGRSDDQSLFGRGAFERVKKRRRRPHGDAPSGAAIQLSNSTALDSASVGDTIGTLSVAGGSGVYTFSLLSNPGGLFSIVGSALQVAAGLSVGSDPITVGADNGAGSTPSGNFTIVVSSALVQSEPFPIIF